jgi:spermidine synthase
MRPFALYTVVSISGAAVLAIEILGTRILGPFYGVGLFLWSALISVTLAALSVGYALGGRWADRGPRALRLAFLLAIAGAWLIAVPWIRHPLLAISEHLGLRAAVLLTSTLLFFPPLMLLGMVSPYAIRLRATRLEEVGRTAGDLYAISTVASVIAAVATGFWLIPVLGVTRLTLAVALTLFVAATLAWIEAREQRGIILPALLAVALLVAGATFVRPADGAGGATVFLGQSPYAELRVMDVGNVRYLLIDGGVHTAVERDTDQPLHPYVIVAELAKELFDHPGRLLMVGLGGGSAAAEYAWDGWKVDAVEIDPMVVRVAREYFHLRDAQATVHVMDGRRYLKSDTTRRDIVFFDAYGSTEIPFHLITDETFHLSKSRLTKDGVLIVNLEAVGWNHIIVRSVAATLRRSFTHVVALPIAEPPDQRGNVVLFAADRPMQISDAALGDPLTVIADDYEHWRVVERNHAWLNRFEPEAAGAQVLTDDLNPVDVWAEQINRVARRELHELFARERSW